MKSSITALAILISLSGIGAEAGKCVVTYTFDDGLADQYTIAYPMFRQTGLPATFFIIGSKVGDANGIRNKAERNTPVMTWDQIRDLSTNGMEIASHGWAHAKYAKMNRDEILDDIRRNQVALKENAGVDCVSFASPFNTKKSADGSDIEALVKEAGLRAMRMKQRGAGGKMTAEQMNALVESAKKKGEWLVFMIHGMARGYDAWENPQELEKHLAWVKEQKGVQVLSFADAASVCADDARDIECSITVDADKVRFPVAPDMWGIFFEDIDLSLDGGIYAEMVRNRSFEEGRLGREQNEPLAWWDPVGAAYLSADTSKPLSSRNARCVRVGARPGAGIANQGYFGMNVEKGKRYNLSVALRGEMKGPVEVSFEAFGKAGTIGRGTIAGITSEWKTHELSIEATDSDPRSRLVFRAPEGGTFYMDCVSLFPAETYGKSGLFRKDLMEKLAALKPSFVRFPGGCWVEGDTMKDAYRWKTTLGSIWERRTQWNIWKYWSSNGVGFHEYLLLCEELGAKPLFCINTGMSHKENVPMEKMDEFVQDALDCIEYCNGGTDTKWGAARAAAGHPEPFNLEYLEIGNENFGEAYTERYKAIAEAVRSKYPSVKLIFNYFRRWNVTEGPRDIRDDHYYDSPGWFMANASRYADRRKFPADGFKVFVGEYAVTRGTRPYGSLRAAIGEAMFMVGLENAQDVVSLAAYAPLFANAQHLAWSPNLINVVSDGCFVSPSWNVQRLFSEYRGQEVLDCRVDTPMFEPGEKNSDGSPMTAPSVAASAVKTADGTIVLKVVNPTTCAQSVRMNLKGRARHILFTGPEADACNSLYDREALKEVERYIVLDGVVELPPLSLSVYVLDGQQGGM